MRTTTAIALAASLLTLTAGCGSDDAGTSSQPDPSASTAGKGGSQTSAAGTVLDVRTPEEFAEGHLAGALNIDVSAPDFDQRVAELSPGTAVVVYCRSGNRSAAAVQRMAALGFTDLTDAGGLEQATSSTGLEIVTD